MDIILKQDIPNLGYKNDIITVKNGYARNYLIPKGLAVIADESSRKVLAEVKKQRAFKEEKIKKEAETLAKALETLTLRIPAKSGTSGKIFGSVNAIQISQVLKDQFNYDVDRKLIEVDGESIKELGTYKAKVKLHKEVDLDLNFEVYSEED